jgi:hypothetical protein
MKSFLRLNLLIFIVAVFIVSCNQWRVSELKSKKLFNIKAGLDVKQANIVMGSNDILEISFTVHAGRDRFFIADNRSKRLQVFDNEGNILCAIAGKKLDAVPSSTTFNFGVIGEVVSDSEGKIFVQNRIEVTQNVQNIQKPQGEIGVNPSYILVFDKIGRLQYTMGQKGPAEMPFYNIESTHIDTKDRLWVISKNYETWSVFRFKARMRDFFVTLGKDNFGQEKDGANTYNGIIENVVPFNNGGHFLISVAYYINTRFKYRKIFDYSVDENKLERVVLQLPDPRNELYAVLDDKYLLLWDTEEKNLRFAIWDLDGNIVNNLRIRMEKDRSSLVRVISDEKGRLYSYVVKKAGIDILEWR